MRRFVVLLILLAGCAPVAAESGPPVVRPEPVDSGIGAEIRVLARELEAPEPAPTPPETTTTTTTSPPVAIARPPAPVRSGWHMATTTGELPDEFADGLRAIPGVVNVSVVRGGNAHVTATRRSDGTLVDQAPEGLFLPIQVQAFLPDDHAPFVPEAVAQILFDLAEDEVALGAMSADFRGLDPGATVEIDGGALLTVTAVIPDEWVGAAEIVTTRPDPDAIGFSSPRYVIFRFEGDRSELEAAVAALSDQAVVLRAEEEVPILRHADAVPAQIEIKRAFGEFAYRPAQGRSVVIDPAWVDENIVSEPVPILGNIRCHRDFIGRIRGALARLEDAGLDELIDVYLGCWNPRFITGRTELSRHAWGVAADINLGNPLEGPGSPIAKEFLLVMADAGLTSGHLWRDPDPGHFEWDGE